MIAIVNVSDKGTSLKGTNHYEVRINEKVITKFSHERIQGLAKCLRDAADAVEAKREADIEAILKLANMAKQCKKQ